MLCRYAHPIDDHDAAPPSTPGKLADAKERAKQSHPRFATDDDGAGAAMASETGEWRRGKGRTWRLVEEGIAGGAASAAACLASNPIDGIRCRQQLKTRPPILGTSTLQAAA